MSIMEHPCGSEEHRSAVEPSEEATFDTVREIRSYLENIQEKRKRDLACAHRALLDGDSTHGLQDVNAVNDEIKALFESVERLLRLSPSPGVQTQWNRQQRSFKEEAIQCSEANLKFKKRWKEIRNASQRRQISNHGTHGDINSIEAQLQNPRQVQFTSRRTTPIRELIKRSNCIHQYADHIEDINDMAAYLSKFVHRQDPSIVQIQNNAATTATESGKASAELDGAVISARNTRRWKWYAFILILVIFIVLGIIVGSVIGFRRTDNSSHSSRA